MIPILSMKAKKQRKVKQLIQVTQLVDLRSQSQVLLTLEVILLTTTLFSSNLL